MYSTIRLIALIDFLFKFQLSAKGDKKTEAEKEREQSLINQWVALTEERNAISVPAANSDIPGSPAEW